MTACGLLTSLSLSLAVTLPPSTRRYDVAVEIRSLVDNSRVETFNNQTRTARAFMVSVFYPIAGSVAGTSSSTNACAVDYMPPATGAAEDQDYGSYGWGDGALAKLKMPVCNSTDGAKPLADAPVVVLSPALGTPRHFYNAQAESIAGQGYIVATVDHPYDGSVVEFPDGTVITGIDIEGLDLIDQDLDVRTGDLTFTLDSLANGTFQLGRSLDASSQYSNRSLAIDVSRALAMGHSMGGSAAVAAALTDRRVVGALNLDGEFVGPVIEQGLDKPVLILASNGTDDFTLSTWNQTWPNLRGWKREVRLIPSTHMTLSDVPLLVHALGSSDLSIKESGSMDGVRERDVMQAYMTAYFDQVLTNQPSPLLEQANPTFPEMVIVQ